MAKARAKERRAEPQSGSPIPKQAIGRGIQNLGPDDSGITRADLVSAVSRLHLAKLDWQSGPEKQLSREFEQGWLALRELAENAEATHDKASLINDIGILGLRWQEFAGPGGYGSKNTGPNREFWLTYESMLKRASGNHPEDEPVKKLEPIAQLRDEKVNIKQIARMYGWFHLNGEPDVSKVWEEIETPGTHVGPDFVPPMEVDRRKAEKARNLRASALIAEAKSKREAEVAALPGNDAGAETVEQLLQMGTNVPQIHRMTGAAVEEIRDKAAELGITPAELGANSLGDYDKPRSEDEQRILDSLTS